MVSVVEIDATLRVIDCAFEFACKVQNDIANNIPTNNAKISDDFCAHTLLVIHARILSKPNFESVEDPRSHCSTRASKLSGYDSTSNQFSIVSEPI